MSMKKPKNDKMSRYSNSVVFYKSLSCRASLYEDRVITDFCNMNGLSKSLFLTAAAMYCINNDISKDDLLRSTVNSSNSDYKDYYEEDEYDD